MLLGFEIGQRWPEAVMHSCGSYFVPVPKHQKRWFDGGDSGYDFTSLIQVSKRG
jgi:hypothetical protein